jgi:hypothetical protein
MHYEPNAHELIMHDGDARSAKVALIGMSASFW